MASIYAIYYTATGEINQIYHGDDPSLYVDATEAAILVDSSITDTTHYVVGGVVTPRPLLTTLASWDTTSLTADGTSTITFGNTLPVGTTYVIHPPTGAAVSFGTITDGSLSITTLVPGEYEIELKSFPYQPYSERIFAVDIETLGLTVNKVFQSSLPVEVFDYSGGVLEVYAYAQTSLPLYQDLEDTTAVPGAVVLDLASYIQNPLDISLENSYNLILDVAEFLQFPLDVSINVSTIELEVYSYIQSSPIPDSLESFANLYVSEILQESLELTTDKNLNQLLFVASYTQASLEITL